MDNRIVIDGLPFRPYITRDKIKAQVEELAGRLREDLKDSKPIFLCVLNGAFVFAADLLRAVGMNHAKIQFVKYSSYEGTKTTGKVKQLLGLNEDLEGQDVVIIEDIVDTGLTAEKMVNDIKLKNPRSVRFVTLLHKPANTRNAFKPDYVAFSIPEKFIVGYGLDLDGKARNLEDIYVIEEEEDQHH